MRNLLERDLSLWIEDWHTGSISSGSCVGNSFNENVTGVADGYSYGFSPVDSSAPHGVNNVELVAIPAGVRGPKTSPFRIHVSALLHNPSTAFPTQSFSVYAWNVRCWKSDSTSCLNQ